MTLLMGCAAAVESTADLRLLLSSSPFGKLRLSRKTYVYSRTRKVGLK